MARQSKVSKMYRQGDVLLLAVDETEIPQETTPIEREGGRVVLAHGEVTGHAHAITEPGAQLVSGMVPARWRNDPPEERRFLLIRGGATLRHEEHAPIALMGGAYRVIRQREYRPESREEVSYVRD